MATTAQSPISPIVVLYEDPIIHDDDHPYCDDPDCPCKDDLAEQEAQAERRYIEIGFTERWECLPWNGGY